MEIINHPNYLIYEDGKVFSKKSNKFLKHNLGNNGYKRITLCSNNKPTYHLIHRLIGLHYIPNPDNKSQIDHIDRNRLNNDISNLRWATRKENMNNKSKRITNISGYTNIFYNKRDNVWVYSKGTGGYRKYFISKIDAICFKFIYILKHKSKL